METSTNAALPVPPPTPCSALSDLLPPREIIDAAASVWTWMEQNGYRNWQLGGLCDRRFATTPEIGRWTPVAEAMPDDDMTVLVWVESLDDATLAYHDSDVLSRRGDSGWIMAETVTPGRVLIGVTHWCADINRPNVRSAPTGATEWWLK